MIRWITTSIMLWSILIVGCKSTEDIPRAKKVTITELLEQVKEEQKNYQWFSAKAKIKFEGTEMRIGGRSNIRMIKDSLLWMNFKKVSIEGSRAMITQDSFWILYRLDDLYESGSFEELMDYYNISLSYSQLQSLMVDNVIMPKEDEVRSFRTKKLHYIDFYLDQDYYQYAIDGDYNLREMIINDVSGRTLSVSFEDFGEDGFARKKNIKVLMPNNEESSISLSFNDVEFDVPKTIKFEVPTHYTKLP